MKTTKKNGAKRNPVLVLAVLGLLVGAGATGAIAAGLIPSLDTGVNGSISATVETNTLLSVNGTGLITYGSDGSDVKFSKDIGTITAPGSALFSMGLTVNRLEAPANAVLINMKGINEYTRVSLTANNGTAVRLGDGEWAITGLDALDTTYLIFNIYVSQQSVGFD